MLLRALLVCLSLWSSLVRAEQVELRVDRQFIETRDSFAVIEPVWWSVSIYHGPARYESDLTRFSVEQRYVFACHWYLAEVRNGGHEQFFDNSTGIVWRDAVAGFHAMGLTEVADVIVEAGRRMGGTPSMKREERQAVLKRMKPDFQDLDARLLALERSLGPAAPITSYVRKNSGAFVFSGKVSKP